MNECAVSNGGCAQICSDLPVGKNCSCYSGYTFDGSVTNGSCYGTYINSPSCCIQDTLNAWCTCLPCKSNGKFCCRENVLQFVFYQLWHLTVSYTFSSHQGCVNQAARYTCIQNNWCHWKLWLKQHVHWNVQIIRNSVPYNATKNTCSPKFLTINFSC